MARKKGHNSESISHLALLPHNQIDMAQLSSASEAQRNVKQKVQDVKKVIKNRSMEEIILVLQYYEYDVERTVQAFLYDNAQEALNEWTRLGTKSGANKKKKNKKRTNQESASAVPQTSTARAEGQGATPATPVGSQTSRVQGQASMLATGAGQRAGPAAPPSKATGHVRQVVNSRQQAQQPSHQEAGPVNRGGPSNQNRAQNVKATGEPVPFVDVIPRTRTTSSSSQKGVTPQKALESTMKDFQRHTASLQRIETLYDQEIEKSFRRIRSAFDEYRREIDRREAALTNQLQEVKTEGKMLLLMRQRKAVDLRHKADQSAAMNERQLTELRSDIKHFVNDRRIDEDFAKVLRFTYNPDHIIDDVQKFGVVEPIHAFYAQSHPSVPNTSAQSDLSSTNQRDVTNQAINQHSPVPTITANQRAPTHASTNQRATALAPTNQREPTSAATNQRAAVRLEVQQHAAPTNHSANHSSAHLISGTTMCYELEAEPEPVVFVKPAHLSAEEMAALTSQVSRRHDGPSRLVDHVAPTTKNCPPAKTTGAKNQPVAEKVVAVSNASSIKQKSAPIVIPKSAPTDDFQLSEQDMADIKMKVKFSLRAQGLPVKDLPPRQREPRDDNKRGRRNPSPRKGAKDTADQEGAKSAKPKELNVDSDKVSGMRRGPFSDGQKNDHTSHDAAGANPAGNKSRERYRRNRSRDTPQHDTKKGDVEGGLDKSEERPPRKDRSSRFQEERGQPWTEGSQHFNRRNRSRGSRERSEAHKTNDDGRSSHKEESTHANMIPEEAKQQRSPRRRGNFRGNNELKDKAEVNSDKKQDVGFGSSSRDSRQNSESLLQGPTADQVEVSESPQAQTEVRTSSVQKHNEVPAQTDETCKQTETKQEIALELSKRSDAPERMHSEPEGDRKDGAEEQVVEDSDLTEAPAVGAKDSEVNGEQGNWMNDNSLCVWANFLSDDVAPISDSEEEGDKDSSLQGNGDTQSAVALIKPSAEEEKTNVTGEGDAGGNVAECSVSVDNSTDEADDDIEPKVNDVEVVDSEADESDIVEDDRELVLNDNDEDVALGDESNTAEDNDELIVATADDEDVAVEDESNTAPEVSDELIVNADEEDVAMADESNTAKNVIDELITTADEEDDDDVDESAADGGEPFTNCGGDVTINDADIVTVNDVSDSAKDVNGSLLTIDNKDAIESAESLKTVTDAKLGKIESGVDVKTILAWSDDVEPEDSTIHINGDVFTNGLGEVNGNDLKVNALKINTVVNGESVHRPDVQLCRAEPLSGGEEMGLNGDATALNGSH